MPTNTDVTRRSFMQMVGGSGLLSLTSRLPALGPSLQCSPGLRFAYVASNSKTDQGIHVFSVANGRWMAIQFVTSSAPSALALSPDKRTLFVANRIRRYQSLPTASVEAYRIEAASGQLTLINRQALALSAVDPEYIAVSPNGKHLAVSATGGGAYNVLPIAEDGSLQPVAALRKEVGSSSHPLYQASSQPQQIMFDRTGRLLATDLGTDRVSVFELADDSLLLKQRATTAPESGPSMVAIAGRDPYLFVGNALNGTVVTYRYEEATGNLASQKTSTQTVASSNETLASLALHTQSNFLYTATRRKKAGTITAWAFNSKDGALTKKAKVDLQGEPASLSISPAANNLFALDVFADAILALNHDPASAEITSSTVADVLAPTAWSMIYS
jgi:6-phosphogluconolactonase